MRFCARSFPCGIFHGKKREVITCIYCLVCRKETAACGKWGSAEDCCLAGMSQLWKGQIFLAGEGVIVDSLSPVIH